MIRLTDSIIQGDRLGITDNVKDRENKMFEKYNDFDKFENKVWLATPTMHG